MFGGTGRIEEVCGGEGEFGWVGVYHVVDWICYEVRTHRILDGDNAVKRYTQDTVYSTPCDAKSNVVPKPLPMQCNPPFLNSPQPPTYALTFGRRNGCASVLNTQSSKLIISSRLNTR